MTKKEAKNSSNLEEEIEALKQDFGRWGYDPGVVESIKHWGEIRRFDEGDAFVLEINKREMPREGVALVYHHNIQTAEFSLSEGGLMKSILLRPEVVIQDIVAIRIGNLLGLPVMGLLGEKAVLLLSKDAQFSVRTFDKDSAHPFSDGQRLINSFFGIGVPKQLQ